MIIVDAHCDTINKIAGSEPDLYQNIYHADIRRMLEAGSYVQFFAAFVNPLKYRAVEMRRAVQLIDILYGQAEKYTDFMSICRNYIEIKQAFEEKKVAAIISIEGAEALQGELSALRMYYRLGVRSICLTWNCRNEIADSCRDDASGGGLSEFGREVVAEMNRLGMLIDVSHISDKGFEDVIRFSKAPVIASHSNARNVCNHSRNLTDEQILALKSNGGVMGINLYPHFLNNTQKASLDNIIEHINHIVDLGCEDNIGLGTDFDGIECTPDEISGVEDIYKIFERLLACHSQSFVDKFAGGNFLRVIKEVL